MTLEYNFVIWCALESHQTAIFELESLTTKCSEVTSSHKVCNLRAYWRPSAQRVSNQRHQSRRRRNRSIWSGERASAMRKYSNFPGFLTGMFRCAIPGKVSKDVFHPCFKNDEPSSLQKRIAKNNLPLCQRRSSRLPLVRNNRRSRDSDSNRSWSSCRTYNRNCSRYFSLYLNFVYFLV